MKTKLGTRGRMALAVLLVLVATGCASSPTGPDAVDGGRTSLGISVSGGDSAMYPQIDREWTEVNECWANSMDGRDVTVEIMDPAFTDKSGLQVFSYGSSYYYGLRIGNKVKVCPDLAALKHEFSHLVGQDSTGDIVQNGAGKCYL